MRLSYGDATDALSVNLGWAASEEQPAAGFLLDLERGYWATNADDPDDAEEGAAGRQKRVVPYVMDTKNALVIRLEPARSAAEMASLQAALKEAIQQHFQLEPRELACEPMPAPADRTELLFYEASEGGAGVLRQLVDDPAVIAKLARRALELCHFDPDTLEDERPDTLRQGVLRVPARLRQPARPPAARPLPDPRPARAVGAVPRPARRVAWARETSGCWRCGSKCDSKLEQKWLDDARRSGACGHRATRQHLIEVVFDAAGLLLPRVQRSHLRRWPAARHPRADSAGRGDHTQAPRDGLRRHSLPPSSRLERRSSDGTLTSSERLAHEYCHHSRHPGPWSTRAAANGWCCLRAPTNC